MQERIIEAGGKVDLDCYILIVLVYLRTVMVIPTVHTGVCCRWFMLRLSPPICLVLHIFFFIIVASRTVHSGECQDFV